MHKKTLDEMNLIDDFLMSAVASDEENGAECCRIILSSLLDREIGSVHVIAQRFLPGLSPELRGIRMDVEVVESDSARGCAAANIYDLEPHTANDTDFARANRFRQAKVDNRYMKSGDDDFLHLPDLYIITITNFDLFGKDQRIYTFRNSCVEIPDLPYYDGLRHIYFNTKGRAGGSKSVENMLKYIQKSNRDSVVDKATEKLEERVRKIRMDPELRRSVMTFGDIIDRERKEAAREAAREADSEATYRTRINDILELLEDLGEVPESLRGDLTKIKDEELLKRLHKEAAHADSIEAFCLHLPYDL